MADKKKIKNIKNDPSSSTVMITVNDINTKTGVVATADETFLQNHYKALCFNVDDVINTDSILANGISTIVGARRISRGTILSLDTTTNNSGVIEENKTKKQIKFFQPYLKEIGFVVGTEVKYDLVPELTFGGEIAVNVEILA